MVAAGTAAVAELWPQAGAEVSRAAGVHFHGDPGGYFARYASGELSFGQMRQARIADLLESFSLPVLDGVGAEGVVAEGVVAEGVAARFEQAYEPAFADNLHAFDDVWSLVEAARSADLAIGLLTNSSSHYTHLKLEVTGLAGVFAVVATRDTLGFGKPDPRAFHHACKLLGSTPTQTVYVGDHLEIDAIGAARAGLRAVWLQRGPADTPAAVHGNAQAQAAGIPVVSSLSQVASSLTRDDLGASWPAPRAGTT